MAGETVAQAEPTVGDTEVASATQASQAHGPVPEVLQQHGDTDVESFSQLPIEKRTVPAEKWRLEAEKVGRRVVAFQHIALHCQKRQTKDNIIIGVLFYNSSNEKLGNGEQYVKWRFTDLVQPEPRSITVHLRWQACLHWRKHASTASRGSIMAIINPYLVESANHSSSRETLLLVENPKQIEKLGECPVLGACKHKGCKLPCDKRLRETYCRTHLGMLYAKKSIRVATGGGADAKAAALLGQKRPGARMGARAKVARLENEVDAQDETQEEARRQEERQKEEKQKMLQLALRLDDRRFDTAEANECYVKFVRKGMKPEDATMSRVPQLGRGLDASDGLEVVIPSFG